jgi:hypothetical protein
MVVGPLSYVVLGLILGGLGGLFLAQGSTVLGVVGLVAGGGLVVFGGVAEAVRLGITSAGRRGGGPGL